MARPAKHGEQPKIHRKMCAICGISFMGAYQTKGKYEYCSTQCRSKHNTRGIYVRKLELSPRQKAIVNQVVHVGCTQNEVAMDYGLTHQAISLVMQKYYRIIKNKQSGA